MTADIMPMVVSIVGTAALFSFLAVASWATQRRRERESLYLHETLRRLAEQSQVSGERILELLREQETAAARRRREGLKLAALLLIAIGISIGGLLKVIEPTGPHFMLGGIPLLIGGVLFVYAYLLAPRSGVN